MTYKHVNGKNVEMTPEEEAAFEATRNPTQADKDAAKAAQKDRIITYLSAQPDLLLVLVYRDFQALKSATPSLTFNQYITGVRADMDTIEAFLEANQ